MQMIAVSERPEHFIQSLVEVNHIPVAFMGIEEGSLEMLFITPKERGKDLGKQLIQYGIEKFIKEHFFCAPEIFDRRKNQPDLPESIQWGQMPRFRSHR